MVAPEGAAGSVAAGRFKVRIFQHISHAGVETRLSVLSVLLLVIIIGALSAIGITYCRNQPYERQTADEVTATAAQYILTLACKVPVEADTGRRSAGRMKATGLWRNDIRQSQSVRNFVIVVLQLRINGQFETHPGSQSEVVCDIHLVLQIERKLLVLHVRQELGTVPWCWNK